MQTCPGALIGEVQRAHRKVGGGAEAYIHILDGFMNNTR